MRLALAVDIYMRRWQRRKSVARRHHATYLDLVMFCSKSIKQSVMLISWYAALARMAFLSIVENEDLGIRVRSGGASTTAG